MKTNFKILILVLCLFGLVITDGQGTTPAQPVDVNAGNQPTTNTQPVQPAQPSQQQPAQQTQPQVPQVIAEIGQIFPGQIDIAQSKQAIHYIKTGQLQKKYLFIRLTTFDKDVRTALGVYSATTRAMIHSCQNNLFDACYLPSSLLAANTTYIVLIVASDNFKYNVYTYWADLEHIKPNQQIKFMFDETNPTQLFHLEFQNEKEFEQIRIVLKPEAARAQGDNLKIFANLGFNSQPTAQKHDFASIHVWGDAQAIILNKNQLQSALGIGIYIVGHAETVYILQCQFLKHTSHTIKIGEIVNDYLPAEKSATYRLVISELAKTQTFVIKASSFTGQISAEFYYDEQGTQPFQKSPFQYMSDMQFKFAQEDFKAGTKQLFMKIKAYDSEATYQISTQTRTTEVAYEINQNIYEFSVLQKTEALYFYSHIWDSSQFQKMKVFKFDISMIRINGEMQIEYYQCKNTSNEQDCKNITNPKFKQFVQKVKIDGTEQVGAKTITTLEVNQQSYRSLNNVEKRLMVIIVTKNKVEKNPSAFAIQYSNPNQIRLLREARAFEDKVRSTQKKYYKYINNNPKISQIRIHINQISGLTKIRATRNNIKQNTGEDLTIDKNLPDTIIVKDRVTQPIFIEVFGIVNSLYTISVSALHAEHLISNSLIMAQDVQYEVKLLPYQHMNIEMHPIEGEVVLEYYVEGGAVMLCVVDLGDLCQQQKVINSQGEMKINAQNKREVRVRIGNFIDSKTLNPNTPTDTIALNQTLPEIINRVKITLIYHGTQTLHCDQRRMNKVYSQNIKANSCIQYHIPMVADFQIMLARSDIGQAVKNVFFLCSQLFKPNNVNGRFLVKGDQIKQTCKNNTNQILLQILVGVQNTTGSIKPVQFKVQYLVSYDNDTITLADGVAYTTVSESQTQTALHTFFYEIIDEERPINIVLYNKKGIQKFFAKISNKTERYSGFVAEVDAKFSSKSSNYYTNPYINISKSSIADADCGRTCVLVLSVYSSEKAGTQIQFALEVTQNHILLKQDHIRTDFLAKGSVRFYEYESKQGKNTLLFKTSDNHRKCAKSIMSKNPFPTGSNYYVKENEGMIVYEKTEKGTFYFAVEAAEDCPYTVSISESLGKVTKIQYGQFYDIKLEQGKEKYFYMQHISNSTFKIITLKNYGELVIHANPAELNKNILQSIEAGTMTTTSFAFKSTYKNSLVVKSDAKGFCFNCYYLIYVKASKMMEGSIFLGSESSKITISEEKILFDEIETKNAITYATYYKVSDGNLQVKVHKGKIGIQLTYSSQKYSKQFSRNRKVYHEAYNFTKEEGIYAPIEIRVTALEVPALYSFQLSPSQQSKTFIHKVNPGEHTFIYLQKGSTECFEGKITQKQQQIFVSADVSESYLLSNLNISVKIDEAETDKFEKQIVGNILSLTFKAEQTFLLKPKKYHICLNPESKNQSVSLFVFQNVDINLIHSDTEVLVRKQSKFVIYPRNDIILDLFECKGNAEIYYGGNLETIKQKQSHKLDVLGIPGQSHAIKISQFSTLYIDVVAPMATVLWMPLNEKEERGIGYFKYAIGGLEFSSKFNNIEFKVGGIYRLKETQTKVVNIKYTIFVANSKQLLQQAVMCEKSVGKNLVSAVIKTKNVGTSPSHTISVLMDKKRITDTFTQNQTLYFNVVADMTLQSPKSTEDEDHEHYRFIYYQQVVPSEVFRQNKVQAMNLTLVIVLAVVSIVGFVLISCIFVRCIVPALGRLKNRVLVEEKQDPKDQSIPLPPSSDRNQIQNNVPSGTEDQMK